MASDMSVDSQAVSESIAKKLLALSFKTSFGRSFQSLNIIIEKSCISVKHFNPAGFS